MVCNNDDGEFELEYDNQEQPYVNPHLASGSTISNPSQKFLSHLRTGFAPPVMLPITTNSMIVMRQEMNERSHVMDNTLTRKIGIVFNLLIQNMNDSYQQLTTQMSRIADFFDALQVQIQP